MKGMTTMKEKLASVNGKISALDINKVKMKKFSDEKFTALFKDADEIKRETQKALESKGVAYSLINKDKQCICLYTFVKIIDPDNKKTFRLVKTYSFCAEGCREQETQFIEYLKAQIQETILFTGVNSVDWDGEITTAEDIENNSPAYLGMSAGAMVMLGILFSVVLDHPFIGMFFCVLALISLTSGAAIKIGKDRVKIDMDNKGSTEK